ncbi:hypothetical protein CFC35_35760 [Streptomyces sp. FBKL.4005]|uniref:hypothetical protein n=1 Tax=Streptomyces sp. FBKL.4005 TaxID=2015515 RepID=UPI000BCDB9F1|nr:hypothetical protein [Streptomyces sp. FBKL.4005]OYP19185.1 hypothetical protein CFC35_35760 [Streptomyces sp. FBKL.4005]
MTEQPPAGLGRFLDEGDPTALTLIVETPNGLHLRRIPPALPLPAHLDHGTAAEQAAHMAAAIWGMPDFVFQQVEHAAKGSGTREQGDRFLLAGKRGAVVQVKARTITPKPDALEEKWIQKVAAKAMSQAKGSIRQLRLVPADMVSGRGRVMKVDGNDFEWIAVFLLDHPGVPEGTIASWQPIGMPAIALTRRDWDFLFDQLRSTTAVLDYLFRAAAEPPIALGEEPVRYYELAAADADAPSKEIDTELVGRGGTLISTPQLPQAPAGDDGTRAHLMIRVMLEDIAHSPLGGHLTEANRHTVLSDLDRLPVGARAEWGRLLLDMLRDVPEVPDEHVKWRFRRQLDEAGTRQLIVGAATRFGREIQGAFSAYVQLRHHEVTSRTGRTEESSTLGVLLTPRYDGVRAWDTSTVRVHGDLQLSEEELKVYSEGWNRPSDETALAAPE